ncbi:hypothetical protein F4780DRAFT_287481 [Xylariomycetidae sp. FL0641]|nr:hypothetical protein F4780DRAFT_287481 [Xylariomycetidae sp. FL0641]
MGGRPVGYPRWASWIASDADSEPFVFRRFDELAATNLLYLQSKMLDIEAKLNRINAEARKKSDKGSIDVLQRWETLVAQCADSRGPSSPVREAAKERMELILRLRPKIKDYHEALLLQAQIAQLQTPSGRVMRALKQMFYQNGSPMLTGTAQGYLDEKDLVALKSATSDPLSNYLRRYWPQRGKQSDPEAARIRRFKERRINQCVNLVTTLLAIVFLVGPILALYNVRAPPVRLALVGSFTAGFAASVALVTNARRAEVFFGSATYAAVLVVFVSNGDLSGE